MEKIKPGMFYIAADGDGIGKLVGRAVIANDVEELHKVSNRIDAAQDFILHWCENVDGIKVSGGGDEFTAAVPQSALSKLEGLRKSVEKSFGYTISVGVGRSLSEAGTALLVAKLRGKDRVVYFNKKIKEDIKKAKRRVRENRASQEEYKLSEAYLEKAEVMLCDLHKSNMCETHKSKALKKSDESAHKHPEADGEDSRTDDCPYCQDLDAVENADGSAGMHDCPACADYDARNGTSGGVDGCQACAEYDAKNGAAAGAHGGVEGCPECARYDAEQAAGGDPSAELSLDGDEDAAHPDNCPQCQEMYGQAVEDSPAQSGQVDPNLQGHETAEEVLSALDQEPGGPGASPAQEAQQIDNTELPQGDAMKDGVSVTDNFGQAQAGQVPDASAEMAQGQDEPDMAGVLQSGLDDHANEQKKAQVIDMVSQTLAGFKANKASLEATKEQNQPLYNSCIQMLKSMIALCDLLGLKPAQPDPAQAMQSQAAPAAPAAGGAPQGAPAEASPDPKAVG